MKIRVGFITLFLTCLIVFCHGQYRAPKSSNGSFADKVYFGGGGGFSGGSQYLNISVSPLIGYKITEQFSAGLQITYQYVKFIDATANNYGGGPFLRYNFTQKLFGYSQYEYLNYQALGYGNDRERFDFNSLFVGIGYSEPIGNKAAFNITALYNLLHQDGRSPYQSPLVFRVGIVAGLF